MQYLGGKSRLGKQIAYVINSIRKPGQPYWEPFCGSCWVTIHVRGAPRYCSDGCYELIEMWKALQRGWQPPRVVTEEMYAAAKRGEYGLELTAFIGFGCSFGGKWFAGYAKPDGIKRDPKFTANSLAYKIGQCNGVHFFFADYSIPDWSDNMLIYADPPYSGTAGYKGSWWPFDASWFWQTVRQWTRLSHTVIISEYAAPDDFTCVLEMPTHTEMRTTDGRDPRTERLFMHKSQARLYYENVPEQLALTMP